MKKEFMDIFFRDGYRLCQVKPDEINVFYKYYKEGFHIVMILEDCAGTKTEPAAFGEMKERVLELFYHPQGRLEDFPEGFPVYHVDMLTILMTAQMEQARYLCAQCGDIWVYEPQKGRLIIYENQPGDFWGLKGKIEEKQYSVKRGNQISVGTMPVATILIAAVNVLVYIILSFRGPTSNALYMASSGAMYPDFITYNHQWWRFLTAMFLHFGIAHLANNMVIFCCVGSRLEKIIGPWKMLAVYFTAGISGGVLSYVIMMITDDYAVSAGASGAVFGIIGGLLWAVICHRGAAEGMTTRGMLLMLVLSLYFGFTTAGVDNWCHVGGMLGGFLMAVILYHGKRQKY